MPSKRHSKSVWIREVVLEALKSRIPELSAGKPRPIVLTQLIEDVLWAFAKRQLGPTGRAVVDEMDALARGELKIKPDTQWGDLMNEPQPPPIKPLKHRKKKTLNGK